MNKRKALICTVLLTILLCIVVIIIATIDSNYDLTLCNKVFSFMSGLFVAEKMDKFYHWLSNRK